MWVRPLAGSSRVRVLGRPGTGVFFLSNPYLLSSCLSLSFRKSDSYSRNRRVMSGRFLIFRKR